MWGAVHGEAVRSWLTAQHWNEHVHGEGSIGLYPLVVYSDQWRTGWGCIDVDEGYDLVAIAINVWRALKVLGITSWVERSKGKGWHVWTLCDRYVPAESMVAAQRFACQVADYHPKEVNPKQTHLAEGAFGNYVNIPWARKWVVEGKRVIVHAELPTRHPFSLEEWLPLAEASARANTPSVIAKAAALYKPPPPQRPVQIARPTVDPTPRLKGVARKLFEEGPLPSLTTGHIDRSAGLQKLAHLLRSDGFTAGEAYQLVAELDNRLGKYTGRSDAELQIQRIIERAFG